MVFTLGKVPLQAFILVVLIGFSTAFVPINPNKDVDIAGNWKPVGQANPAVRKRFDPWVPTVEDGANWTPVNSPNKGESKTGYTAAGEPSDEQSLERRVVSFPLYKTKKGSDASDPVQEARDGVSRIAKKYLIRGMSRESIGKILGLDGQEDDRSIERRQENANRGGVTPTLSGFTPAITPSTEDSVAVNQDGKDLSYFMVVEVGTHRQQMKLVIDTGSSDTWVPSKLCKTPACLVHNRYDFARSTEFTPFTNKYHIDYGSGNVTGQIIEDIISFRPFSFKTRFGLSYFLSHHFKSFPIDGIVGLGFQEGSRMRVPTIVDVMFQENLIDHRSFGVSLSRASDGLNDGVIHFGGVDTAVYNPPLIYTKSVSKSGLWEVPLEKAVVNGVELPFRAPKTAILDTGTSLMVIPPEDCLNIHRNIYGSQVNGETYAIPCNTAVDITFDIGGQSYTIPPSDYVGRVLSEDTNMCLSAFSGRALIDEDTWLLGAAFLKNLYTVFDLENNRIGIAMKKSKQELLMLGDSRELSSDAPTTTSSLLTRRGGANVPTIIYVMSVLTMTVLAWIL